MLYLDYDSGPWTPNIDGENLNYEGVHFLRRLNAIIKNEHPDVMMIAEEVLLVKRSRVLKKKVDLALTINGIWVG